MLRNIDQVRDMLLHLQLVDNIIEAIVEQKLQDCLKSHLMHRLIIVHVFHKLSYKQVVEIYLTKHGL